MFELLKINILQQQQQTNISAYCAYACLCSINDWRCKTIYTYESSKLRKWTKITKKERETNKSLKFKKKIVFITHSITKWWTMYAECNI